MFSKKELLLFVFLFAAYGMFLHVPLWNDLSRFDLVMAIAHDGSFMIDRFEANTGDKSFKGGHFYSDKAPGSSFLAVPAYWAMSLADPLTLRLIRQWNTVTGRPLLDPLTPGETLNLLKLWMTRIMTVGVVSSLFAVIFYRFLLGILGTPFKAGLLVMGYAMGTLAFPYSTMLFGHQTAAAAIFSAFVVSIAAARSDAAAPCFLLTAVVGFLSGLSVMIEYPTALIAGVILANMALMVAARLRGGSWSSLPRRFAGYALGASIPLSLLLYYQWACFGSPFSVGYETVALDEFKEAMGSGVCGISWPTAEGAWGISFSPYRGMFILSPFLLLVFPAVWAVARESRARGLEESLPPLCAAAVVAAYFLLNAGYCFWNGGWAIGPRHFIPALPFMVYLIANLRQGGLFEKLLAPLVAVSVCAVSAATMVDPQVPASVPVPFLDHVLPRLAAGAVSLTPLHLIGLEGLLVELALWLFLIAGCILFTRPPRGGDQIISRDDKTSHPNDC